MKKFWTLFKVELLNSLSLNSLFSSNSKNKSKKKKGGLAGIIFLSIFMFLVGLFYAFIFFEAGLVIEKPELCLGFSFTIGTIMAIFMTFANAYSVLFKSKDFDLLMSLPLSSKFIVLSKILSITIMTIYYFALLFIPSIIIYFIGCPLNSIPISFISIIQSVLILFANPLLISALFSFVAFLFGIIISKFKHKNIITSILYVIFFIGLMALIYYPSFSMGMDVDDDIAASYSFYNSIMSFIPFTKILIEGIVHTWWYVLLYTIICILLYFVISLIIGKFYLKINLHNKQNIKNSKFNFEKSKKLNSQFKALFIKELKTFFGIPVYLSNCIIGPIMSCIMIVVLSFVIRYKFGFIDNNGISTSIVLAIMCFFNGVGPTTSCAISIEGNNFWITKSMPINPKKILNSKLLLNFAVYAPFTLISSLACIINLQYNLINSILILIIPLIAILMYGMLDLFTDLKHYILKWTNVNVVIKQGSNALIAILFDFLISILLFVPSIILLYRNMNLYATIYVSLIVIILFVIAKLLMDNNGVKRYNAIEV